MGFKKLIQQLTREKQDKEQRDAQRREREERAKIRQHEAVKRGYIAAITSYARELAVLNILDEFNNEMLNGQGSIDEEKISYYSASSGSFQGGSSYNSLVTYSTPPRAYYRASIRWYDPNFRPAYEYDNLSIYVSLKLIGNEKSFSVSCQEKRRLGGFAGRVQLKRDIAETYIQLKNKYNI